MRENVIPNVARIDIDNVDFAAAQIAGALVIRAPAHARGVCPARYDGPAAARMALRSAY